MKIYKPKAEFEQAINIQNTYVELLKNYHKELSDKIKNSKGYDLAKYQLKMYETATKLDEQIELLREKLNHFDKNFINQYNEELKECEENFDSLLKDAFKDLKNNHRVWMQNLKHKIKEIWINHQKAQISFMHQKLTIAQLRHLIQCKNHLT